MDGVMVPIVYSSQADPAGLRPAANSLVLPKGSPLTFELPVQAKATTAKGGAKSFISAFEPQEFPLVSLETLQKEIFKTLGLNPPPTQVEVYVEQQQPTPESTASFIVTGIGKLYERYTKGREGEDQQEVISSFFSAAREGVQRGAEEARQVLQDSGFLDVTGVEDGISQTLTLVYEKLNKLEEDLRASAQSKSEVETAENEVPL